METPVRGQRDSEAKNKMAKMETLIRDAMKLDYAWPFLEPVDETEVRSVRLPPFNQNI